MENLAILISAAGLLLGILSFVSARRKESTEESDRRWREHRSDMTRELSALDGKISTCFAKLDAHRTELTDVRLRIAQEMASKEDVRSVTHEWARRFGATEGKLDGLLESIAGLRKRNAERQE